MKKLTVFGVLFFVLIFAVSGQVSAVSATEWNFNDIPVPDNSAEFVNYIDPLPAQYDVLGFGDMLVAITEDFAEGTYGWHDGAIEGVGLHVFAELDEAQEFLLTFNEPVGLVRFKVSTPNQVEGWDTTINGTTAIHISHEPSWHEILLNGTELRYMSWDFSTFDELTTWPIGSCPNPIPLPPAIWLMGTGLAGLACIRLRKIFV